MFSMYIHIMFATGGNRMSLALEAAYKYYDFDIDENELWNITEHPEVHDLNITIDRERGTVYIVHVCSALSMNLRFLSNALHDLVIPRKRDIL